MNERERFFYDHAGWSYDPATETSEQGRERCARELAAAEAAAKRLGWYTETEEDPDVMDDDVDSVGRVARGEVVNLGSVLYDEHGVVLASLWGIVVESESDPYLEVVAAELAESALTGLDYQESLF